jgi:hypothetical protein
MDVMGQEPSAEPRLRRAGDYLVVEASPCDVAISATSIAQICAHKDWPSSERLPSIEQLVGVISRHGKDYEQAGRRVLSLAGAQPPLGLTIPHEVRVLPASDTELLPLPALFAGSMFSAMLLCQGQPRALVIDAELLWARARTESTRTGPRQTHPPEPPVLAR